MIDQQALIALLISFVAGMSTLIGTIIVFIPKSEGKKTVTFSLGFAAGAMITVSLYDLLPQAQEFLSSFVGQRVGAILVVAFLILGILIAMLIDYFVPHEEADDQKGEIPHQDLFRVGFVSMIAIMLHNFPEGIATFMAGYHDIKLGIAIAIAIMLHNIPEGISVAMPIFFATGSKKKALKYTFLAGISEPIGALLAFLVLKPFINDFVLGAIFSVVAGIMLHISFEELIPSSRQYGYNRLAVFSIFIGICMIPLSQLF